MANEMQENRWEPLNSAGLNLQAVFNLTDLPPDILTGFAASGIEWADCRQLILIGHLGRDFWQVLQQRGMHGSDPVDQFVSERVHQWMLGIHPTPRWKQVFPGHRSVALQRLGALSGWHHSSPFGVGVDAHWGSWFAYRAVVLADTDWPVTPFRDTANPCLACVDSPCISACPAGALSGSSTGTDWLGACLMFRASTDSSCQDRCWARNACPVGQRYRYTGPQMAYHYLQSMPAVREHIRAFPPIIAR